jgi:hypothetical protein
MRRSITAITIVTLLCGAAAPVGCNLNFTPAEVALIQSDLDNFCPILGGLEPLIRPHVNGNVNKAFDNVDLACPPNPAPTNIPTILADLITVGIAIAPYLTSRKAQAAVATVKAHATAMAAAHGVAVSTP